MVNALMSGDDDHHALDSGERVVDSHCVTCRRCKECSTDDGDCLLEVWRQR